MASPLTVGAVMYDPKVSVIWEIIRDFFDSQRCPIDTAFFSTYELQVDALMNRTIDIAWNSPLAWVDAQRRSGGTCRAIAMRDTDRDRVSYFVARRGDRVRGLADLRGCTIATGALDSPQATLIPLGHLRREGLTPGADVTVRRFDVLVGKHGDHIGGERDAARALISGAADAACMIDGNHLLFSQEGTLPTGSTRILAQTPPYDHCNFTVLDDAPEESVRRFAALLLAMSYDDEAVRPLLDLEGLKRWQPGRVEGYAQLNRAVDLFGTIAPWLDLRKKD
jgi:ABC-type phosphate/phosphonate transport system substrate-binding protein